MQEINFNPEVIAETINTLKQQHKVVSKKVLQNILDKRTVCNEEFSYVGDVSTDHTNLELFYCQLIIILDRKIARGSTMDV